MHHKGKMGGWEFRGQDIQTCPVFFPSSASVRPSRSPTPPPNSLCPFSPLSAGVAIAECFLHGAIPGGNLSFGRNKVLAEHLLCLIPSLQPPLTHLRQHNWGVLERPGEVHAARKPAGSRIQTKSLLQEASVLSPTPCSLPRKD